MPFKIEVRPLAAIEITEAYDWYETAKEGLGLEFLNDWKRFMKPYTGTRTLILIMINL